MGEYEERTTEHLRTCEYVKIQCPNDQCGDTFVRALLPFHRRSCRYENTPCRYADLGCKEKPFRKDRQEHEEDYQLHLQITTKSVLEQKQQLQQLKEVLQIKSAEKLTFKVPSFTKKKSNEEEFYSSPFYTSQTGYRFCIRVDTNGNGDGEGTHVSVFAYLMKGDNDDSLTWPFTGIVTVALLNQLEDKNHHTETITFPAHNVVSKRVTKGERGVGLGHHEFMAHSDLQENYLVDDTLFFRVSVDVHNYKPWLECTSTD